MSTRCLKLKRIARFQYGDAFVRDIDGGEVPVFGSNGVYQTTNQANTNAPVILVGRKGSYGKINWSDRPVFASDTTFYIDRTTAPSCELRWLYYALGTLRLDEGNREAAVPGLSRETAHENSVTTPPLPTQRRIAAYLDRETARLDALVVQKETLLELLDEKRASLISHAVTRGLNPKAKLKPSGISWLGDVPEHWEVKELRHIAAKGTKITYGIVQAGPDIPDGIPYIRTSDMSGDFLPEEGYQRTSAEIDQSYARSRVYEGDMVISIRASVGKTLSVPGYLNGANLTQGTAKVSPGERIASRFLFHWMNSHPVQRYLGSISKGTTFKEITLEMLRRTPILVPAMDEQERIVQACDRSVEVFRCLNNDIKTSITLLREKRSSLISAAVTGEMAVR